MADWQIRCRTVVEEPKASVSIDRLKRKYERFEEQWDGFIWLVARTPENNSYSMIYENEEYHLAHRKGEMKLGLPDFAVVYQFDEDNVRIIDIEAWAMDSESIANDLD